METKDYDNKTKTNRKISRLGVAALGLSVAIYYYHKLVLSIEWPQFFKSAGFITIVALQLIGYTMVFYAMYQKSKRNAILAFIITFGAIALVFLIIKLIHPSIWTWRF